MGIRTFYPSLTRITSLNEVAWTPERLRRPQWEMGDYVLCDVDRRPTGADSLELANGRMVELSQGDRFIGALGVRSATLEVAGSWEHVGDDGRMDLLTSAGLVGAMTSKSPYLPELVSARYLGHLIVDDEKATMPRYARKVEPQPFELPTVLMAGTSMSAGKTTASKTIIRRLREAERRVVGAKLAGAGRYRDILNMADAGADWIYDFVDAGLPSTVCAEEVYRRALSNLLSMMMVQQAAVAVVEIGASPLEPYNGAAAIEAIREAVQCTVLAASDPYAAHGLMHAFDITPNFICGPAVNTDAGKKLTQQLCGVPALNVIDPDTHGTLDRILSRALEIPELEPEDVE